MVFFLDNTWAVGLKFNFITTKVRRSLQSKAGMSFLIIKQTSAHFRMFFFQEPFEDGAVKLV